MAVASGFRVQAPEPHCAGARPGSSLALEKPHTCLSFSVGRMGVLKTPTRASQNEKLLPGLSGLKYKGDVRHAPCPTLLAEGLYSPHPHSGAQALRQSSHQLGDSSSTTEKACARFPHHVLPEMPSHLCHMATPCLSRQEVPLCHVPRKSTGHV